MDAKDEVKARLSIEDVVGEYVQLKRAGRSFKGLSPFNPEKTPSFVVSPDKQIWHDFSSGRGGDMFSFVMEMEGLDFREALELLARRAGVDMEQFKQAGSRGPNGKTKERLYAVLELAAKFYQAQFSRNKTALEYVLKTRAFSKETALEWQLGYSPNNGTALIDFLKKQGYGENELTLAGLTSKHYRGGVQDMFRGRLQIPLCDAQGRVIGFTARLLEENPQAPKYINTPATPLYDKSRHVYGLHLAKDAIRRTNYSVLAEGNLDVIASHQAGIRQVVATAGTALTEFQLKALNRFSPDVRLSFDADRAGISATERAIPIAFKVGVNLSMVSIVSGKDPDELIRQDRQAWVDAIEHPLDAMDWLIEQYRRTEDLETRVGRENFKKAVFELLRRLESSGERSLYADKIAVVLGYPSGDAVREELRLAETGEKTYKAPKRSFEQPLDKESLEKRKVEDNLLALALIQPDLRTYLQPLSLDMFDDQRARALADFLQRHPDYDGKANAETKDVQILTEYGKIIALVYETLYQGLEPLELGYEAERMQAKLVAQYVRIQKRNNNQALQGADPETEQQLLERDVKLNQLLRTYQGGGSRGQEER